MLTVSKIIQEQYQEYPYPLRDPESEKGRLISLIGSSLAEINHWLFRGKESFVNGFRVLVAGGGTGDASTFLGLQLKDTDAEVVYLDFSQKSMEIAKKRAERWGLKNIRWVSEDILHLPKLGLGKFDYMDCTGVLHHLESPLEGLKLLRDSLTEQGGMNIMLYGKYGRSAVYQIQKLLKLACKGVKNRKEEIALARRVIASLPQEHPFFQMPAALLEDLKSDEGFYDVCLHKQDTAYTIAEIYELVEKAGLYFVDFFEPAQRRALLPEKYIQDEGLLSHVKTYSLLEQQSFIELLSGDMFRHAFCVSRQKNAEASVADLDLVPSFYPSEEVLGSLKTTLEQEDLFRRALNVNLNFGSFSIKIPLSLYTKTFFEAIDGMRSFREIFDETRAKLKQSIPDAILIDEMKRSLEPLIASGFMLFRDKSIKPFEKWI